MGTTEFESIIIRAMRRGNQIAWEWKIPPCVKWNGPYKTTEKAFNDANADLVRCMAQPFEEFKFK